MSLSFSGGVGGCVRVSLVFSEPVNMSPRSNPPDEVSSSPKTSGGKNGGPMSTTGKPASPLERLSVRGSGETLFVFGMVLWSGRKPLENGSRGISWLSFSDWSGASPRCGCWRVVPMVPLLELWLWLWLWLGLWEWVLELLVGKGGGGGRDESEVRLC